MFQEYFSASELLLLPLFGLFLFLGAFGAILYWVLVGMRKSDLPERMAQLPLSDGPLVEKRPKEPNHE